MKDIRYNSGKKSKNLLWRSWTKARRISIFRTGPPVRNWGLASTMWSHPSTSKSWPCLGPKRRRRLT